MECGAGEYDHVSCQVLSFKSRSRLLRSAGWRKTPASDSQKDVIAKRWRVRPGSQSGFSSEEERMDKIHGLTKGQAADILTRLRHGGQVSHHMMLTSTSNSLLIGPFS